jgi:hypothetical protein
MFDSSTSEEQTGGFSSSNCAIPDLKKNFNDDTSDGTHLLRGSIALESQGPPTTQINFYRKNSANGHPNKMLEIAKLAEIKAIEHGTSTSFMSKQGSFSQSSIQ